MPLFCRSDTHVRVGHLVPNAFCHFLSLCCPAFGVNLIDQGRPQRTQRWLPVFSSLDGPDRDCCPLFYDTLSTWNPPAWLPGWSLMISASRWKRRAFVWPCAWWTEWMQTSRWRRSNSSNSSSSSPLSDCNRSISALLQLWGKNTKPDPVIFKKNLF